MTDSIGAQNWTVSGFAPTHIIYDTQTNDSFIINRSSTNTVYLSTESGVTPTSGAPLGPLSQKVWNSGSHCYAVSDNNQSTILNVSYNSGAIADPISIGNAILNGGLATAIANAINVVGIPPIDTFATTYSATVTVSGTNSGTLDVSKYQSITVAMTSGVSDSTLNYRLDVEWRNNAGNLIFTESVFCGTGGYALAQLTVKAPMVRYTSVIVGSPAAMQINVYGSYRSVSTNYAALGGAGSSGNGVIDGGLFTGMTTWTGSIPLGTTWVWQPDMIAGKMKMSMRFTNGASVAGNIVALVWVPNTIYGLSTYLAPYVGAFPNYPVAPAATQVPQVASQNEVYYNGQTDIFDLILPPIPVEISLQNTSATTAATMRVTITSERPYAA